MPGEEYVQYEYEYRVDRPLHFYPCLHYSAMIFLLLSYGDVKGRGGNDLKRVS